MATNNHVRIRADLGAEDISPTLAANQTVKALRQQGKTVLHMGFGESPFPVHDLLRRALADAAHRKDYIPTAGEEALRSAVAKFYAEEQQVDMNLYDVVITSGSKVLLFVLQMAIEGDIVLPDPSWVTYDPQAKMLGNKRFFVPTTLDDDGYHISSDDLRRVVTDARNAGANPTKIIVNFPNNPTGLAMPLEEMKQLAATCRELGLLIVADEIYGFCTYPGTPFDPSTATKKEEGKQPSAPVYYSFAHIDPANVFVTTGLSKHLALGGWRLGFGLVPKSIPGLHALVTQFLSETTSCVAAPISQASVVAFDPQVKTFTQGCTEIHEHVSTYVYRGLLRAGAKVAKPSGGFYCYPDFSHCAAGALEKAGIKTSADLVSFMAEHHNLVCLPGTAFGAPPTRLCARLSCQDYDGTAAIRAFEDGKWAFDDDTIHAYCPNVVAAVNAWIDFGVKIGATSSSS